MLNLKELQVGQPLPGLSVQVNQLDIGRYAQAASDFNPIHLDAEFALKTPSKGIIAHGMLVLAYISRAMTAAFGITWLQQGKMDVRLKTPARPGDTLNVSGKITKIQNQGEVTVVRCEVACTNQKGETVISGEAGVTILA